MKLFTRRLRIGRETSAQSKGPWLGPTETWLFILAVATAIGFVVAKAFDIAFSLIPNLEDAFFWLHLASIGGLWVLWILLYHSGRPERRQAGSGRLKIGALSLAGGAVIVYLPMIAIAYHMAFPDLSEQLRTDAYLQEHAEAMASHVDHFTRLVEEGKVEIEGVSADDAAMSAADRLSHLMLFRAPLALKSWAGEISPEDARRHVFWHTANLENFWRIMPADIKDVTPAGAKHPVVLFVDCNETRSGRIIAAPGFMGARSYDTENPAYQAFPDIGKKIYDEPGQIHVPAPIFQLDVSGIDYMKPLAKACSDLRPDFG